MSEWSKWSKFTEEALNNIPNSAGVYKIRCPHTLPRVLNKDEDGILAIGKSNNLKKRLKQFWETVNGKSSEHAEGITYYDLYFDKIFPPSELEFSFKEVPDKDVDVEEARLLGEYEEKYGELPPLNKRCEEPNMILSIDIDEERIELKKGNNLNDFIDVLKVDKVDVLKNPSVSKPKHKYAILLLMKERKRWVTRTLLDTDNESELQDILKIPLNEIKKKFEERNKKFEEWRRYLNSFFKS